MKWVEAGTQAIRDACPGLIQTIDAIVEAGQEAIVIIAETGAKVKAAAGSLIDGSMVFISKINPLNKSYRIKALSGITAKGDEAATADTIGDVYIVNVKDGNGDSLSQFSPMLELTLGYTEADLGDHILEIAVQDLLGNLLEHSETFVINDLVPVIVHDPVTTGNAGVLISISAAVTDDQEVADVFLSFRAMTGEMPYELIVMDYNAGTGVYEALIPLKYMTGHGVRYFIRALDISGNITQTTPSDIAITDLAGPDIPGGVNVVFDNDQFNIFWQTADDFDTAGYILFRGEDPGNMVDEGDLGLTNFEILNLSWDDHFIGIAAFDDFNNLGIMTTPLLVGKKTDLDRDRDVDGNDITGIITRIEAGDHDISVEEAARGFGQMF